MNRIVLIVLLALGSAAGTFAQTAPAAGKAPAAAQTAAPAVPAPLPDEKTLTITDTAAPGTASAPVQAADVTVWDFVKMFVILALVIGMILGFVWFMRRLSGQGPSEDSPMKVLHTQTLGGSRSLQVVDVGGSVLLVGVSDSGVSLVKDLTGTEAGDAFRLRSSQAKTGGKPFADLLGGLMGVRPKIRPDAAEPAANSSDFLKKQRERLKNL